MIEFLFNTVSNVSTVTIDEHINGYQPSHKTKEKAVERGEPIPVVYIPRKPHPNGLLIYLMCSYVDHPQQNNKRLPFVIDIEPHLKVGDVSPEQTVRTFMNRYIFYSYCEHLYCYRYPGHWVKPHIVGDSAFGSFNMIQEIENWGGLGTLAISRTESPWLWNTLDQNLSPNHWRAAKKNSIVSSLHVIVDDNDKMVTQQIVSNGFTGIYFEFMDELIVELNCRRIIFNIKKA